MGLQNGLPSWADLFDKFFGYEIIFLPIEDAGGYVYFSTVKFTSGKDKNEFIRSLGIDFENGKMNYEIQSNNKTYIVKLISEKEIYFYETDFGIHKQKEYQIE